jgi:hypothetical protein
VDEKSVFLDALNTPPGSERMAWLDDFCGNDPPLGCERMPVSANMNEQTIFSNIYRVDSTLRSVPKSPISIE